MKKKWLVVGIILLFVGTCIIPAIAQDTEKPLPASRGRWLYVGGSGPGNYTNIRDAINDSSPGDTVYVYQGTYHEALRINVTSLTVIGEGREITIIDANFTSIAVVILQNDVVLRGFNIIGKNYCIYVAGDTGHITISHNNLSEDNYHGVEFDFYGENRYNIIENNVFYSDSCGICIQGFSDDGYNIIRNNTFVDNWDGIYIGGTQNQIIHNKFLNSRDKGICLYGEKSLIENNLFIGNNLGVDLDNVYDWWDSQNRIIGNHFENNEVGLALNKAHNTLVTQNNFVHNKKHATFREESRSHGNSWDNNYWSGLFYLFEYKFIFGRIKTRIQTISFDPEIPSYYYMRWINFDRNPAKEPYDILEMR